MTAFVESSLKSSGKLSILILEAESKWRGSLLLGHRRNFVLGSNHDLALLVQVAITPEGQ